MFNLYITNLPDKVQLPCFQYADNITILAHGKPNDLSSLQKLVSWPLSTNLALNLKKTKIMVMSTKQLSKHHMLQNYNPALKIKEKT